MIRFLGSLLPGLLVLLPVLGLAFYLGRKMEKKNARR